MLAAACGSAWAQVPPAAAPAAARVIELDIVARKPVGGVRTVRLTSGESIVLALTADERLSVHVHGYEAHADVVPGAMARLPLVARWQGRFAVAAHLPAAPGHRATEPTLLYLEVYPP